MAASIRCAFFVFAAAGQSALAVSSSSGTQYQWRHLGAAHQHQHEVGPPHLALPVHAKAEQKEQKTAVAFLSAEDRVEEPKASLVLLVEEHVATLAKNAHRHGSLLELESDWSAPKDFYHTIFWPLLALTALMAWATRPRLTSEMPEGFIWFRFVFLFAWVFAVAADWLQGPYVYALYASYGFSSKEISRLFVAGFGSSMVFGTFVGSLADRFGRKRCALLYCALYVLSCITKHFNVYEVLMVGRITGGISTSLLFSTFECWMVAEHGRQKHFGDELLRYMFGLMYFSTYAVAIGSGVLAQWATNLHEQAPLSPDFAGGRFYVGGLTAPFDLALVMLLVAAVPISLFWEENTGERRNSSSSTSSGLKGALATIMTSPQVAMLGFVGAAFEGSMYAFVFNWTPALASESVPPPYGLIFSMFMMACMCGASSFNLVDSKVRPTAVLCSAIAFSAAAFVLVSGSMSVKQDLVAVNFDCFIIFEFCVGAYFPAVGMLKSEIVPEASRAGVYNVFRMPLNFVVCLLLLTDLSLCACFLSCAGFLTAALCCVAALHTMETCTTKPQKVL